MFSLMMLVLCDCFWLSFLAHSVLAHVLVRFFEFLQRLGEERMIFLLVLALKTLKHTWNLCRTEVNDLGHGKLRQETKQLSHNEVGGSLSPPMGLLMGGLQRSHNGFQRVKLLMIVGRQTMRGYILTSIFLTKWRIATRTTISIFYFYFISYLVSSNICIYD